MAYNYDPDVYNTTTDVKTLQQRIEVNFDALLRSFQGTATPNVSQMGTWWYKTDENIMKFKSNTGWESVYDANAHSVILGSSAVGTSNISGSARKGSLVQGENIAPSTCSLRATPVILSLPSMDTNGSQVSVVGIGWRTMVEQRVYIPVEVSTLYMVIRAARGPNTNSATVRFRVGGATSNSISAGSSLSWSTEVSANVSSVSGWSDLIIESNNSSSASSSVIYQGYGFRGK